MDIIDILYFILSAVSVINEIELANNLLGYSNGLSLPSIIAISVFQI